MHLIKVYPIHYLCLKSPLKDGTQIGPYICSENLKYSLNSTGHHFESNVLLLLLLLFIPNLTDLFHVSVSLDRRYIETMYNMYICTIYDCVFGHFSH